MLEALSHLIISSLRKYLKDQVFVFDSTFTKLPETLPDELKRITKIQFRLRLKPLWETNGNALRASYRQDGEKRGDRGSKEFLSVRLNILGVPQQVPLVVPQIVEGAHALFVAAKGETKDFERLQASRSRSTTRAGRRG